MSTIFETVQTLLDREAPFVLATIVSHAGSTPRSSGSKMIITADGNGIGTIGGGLLEATAMSRAVELIRQRTSAIMPVDLSSRAVATMDMICGGAAEVLLDCVVPTAENREVFRAWSAMLAVGGKGCLLTRVMTAADEADGVRADHALANARGEIEAGSFSLTAEQLDRVSAVAASPEIATIAIDGGFVVVEPAIRVCTAYFFGAGHVSRPTAQIAALVGFRVEVADDREAYANAERFPEAGAIRVLDTFDDCLPASPLGPDDYVVIVTRGHLHDKTVLAQALRTGAGYIGMIGSRKKRAAIYRALLDEGFTQADLDRVYSPIGLSIGAETPEEIAVSIVGEMIAVRAGHELG
jgi:xanthine dehydrogenase accessory factor